MTEHQVFHREKAPGRAIVCALVLAAAVGIADAQEYPSKPVRLVIGFPPGGSNDIVARILAPKLGELLGTQIVVENRPGANATIGTEYVARSAPDGYTLTLASVSPLVISPFTYSKLPYDTVNDFAAITTVAMTPEAISVHPALPVKSLKELIALAKSKPGKLDFASSGNGGLPHLTIELLKTIAKIDVQHVPYKGAGPALTDVLGGHVPGFIIDFPVVYPHIKGGRLRGLVVTSESRNPLLPDLPTSGEQGLPKLLSVNWFAVMAPAKTPRPIVEKLHAALVKGATSPDVKERFTAVGVETMTMKSPDVFTSFLKDELVRWGKLAKESGAHAD
jgi:tripartite-type tricarboxylate transporter receptor subunit TctC